jgi:hypothetical protein
MLAPMTVGETMPLDSKIALLEAAHFVRDWGPAAKSSAALLRKVSAAEEKILVHAALIAAAPFVGGSIDVLSEQREDLDLGISSRPSVRLRSDGTWEIDKGAVPPAGIILARWTVREVLTGLTKASDVGDAAHATIQQALDIINEQRFEFDGKVLWYTIGEGGKRADVRYPDTGGGERTATMNAAEGGGAYVGGVSDDFVAAVTALSFQLWPRTRAAP